MAFFLNGSIASIRYQHERQLSHFLVYATCASMFKSFLPTQSLSPRVSSSGEPALFWQWCLGRRRLWVPGGRCLQQHGVRELGGGTYMLTRYGGHTAARHDKDRIFKHTVSLENLQRCYSCSWRSRGAEGADRRREARGVFARERSRPNGSEGIKWKSRVLF